MFLPNSLSTFSILPRDGANARSILRRNTGWLIATLAVISLAFNFPAQTQTLTTLATFNGENGSQPSEVVLDSIGNLYGTATRGGTKGDEGTVWEIAKGSNDITTLATFHGDYKNYLAAGVTIDSSGNLYGIASKCGAIGGGKVWEIAKGSRTVNTLASFSKSNRAVPDNSVTLDTNGNLYGIASVRSPDGYGTVWMLAKGSHIITTLTTFKGAVDKYPDGGITLDTNGNLFGTTFGTLALAGKSSTSGGNGCGTVWELMKGSHNVSTLANFNGANGRNPSGVTLDSNGNLYGTTSSGWLQAGGGTLWELVKGSHNISTLANFPVDNNVWPSSVSLDNNGNIYGTTTRGGVDDYGTVWELAKGSHTITTLAKFGGDDGVNPEAVNPESGVTLDRNGNLFGTTQDTVFEVSANPGVLHWLEISLAFILGLGVMVIGSMRLRKRLMGVGRN